MSDVTLAYVFDAYCGWSYGFARTMVEVAERHPELPVEVVSGGLMLGERRRPIRDFDFIPAANARLTEVTGVGFGEGYRRMLADGSLVLDSEAAARGMAALRGAAPERAVELAAVLQEAHFVDGMDLAEPTTYRAVAERCGLDADAVVAAFEAPEAEAAARSDFRRSRELGVEGFPTLLAVTGDGNLHAIAVGAASATQVESRLAAIGVTS
jgi:putative protein-disulfide isomerase